MAENIKDVVMTVKFFNVKPGYGKLENEQFKNVYTHANFIKDCGGQYTTDGHKLLVPNQQVLCDLAPNPKKPGMMAINVKLCPMEASQQLIEEDLRGDVLHFDPARQSGAISSRQYGHVDFKAQDFNGPAHRLAEKPIVAFDLVRRQGVKMAVNIRALGEGAQRSVTVIERGVLGEVLRIKNTFGFIKAGSRSVFFHLSEIKGNEIAQVGQILRFDLTPGTKGPDSFAAVNISIVSGAVGRAPPRRPGSRAGSTASHARRNAFPPKGNPQRPQRRTDERPSRDHERPEPNLQLDNRQWRTDERPSRDVEELRPQLSGQQKVEEDEERINRMLEEQRILVARQSSARKARPKGEPMQPARLESPERPCRDTEGRGEDLPAAYVAPHLRRKDAPQIDPVSPFLQGLRLTSNPTSRLTSNPLAAPIDPPARHNPPRSNPLQPVMNPRAAGFDYLPSRVRPQIGPVPQPRAPVLSGYRQTADARKSDSDSDSESRSSDSYDSGSSDENDVPSERRRIAAPPPRPVRQQSPSPPRQRTYAAEADPTRRDEIRECSCCKKIVKWPLKTPCGHLFSRECIERWLKFMPTCPLSSCQKDVKLDRLEPAP